MLVKIGHCSQSYHVYKCIVSTKTLDSVETYACKPFIIRLMDYRLHITTLANFLTVPPPKCYVSIKKSSRSATNGFFQLFTQKLSRTSFWLEADVDDDDDAKEAPRSLPTFLCIDITLGRRNFNWPTNDRNDDDENDENDENDAAARCEKN